MHVRDAYAILTSFTPADDDVAYAQEFAVDVSRKGYGCSGFHEGTLDRPLDTLCPGLVWLGQSTLWLALSFCVPEVQLLPIRHPSAGAATVEKHCPTCEACQRRSNEQYRDAVYSTAPEGLFRKVLGKAVYKAVDWTKAAQAQNAQRRELRPESGN